VGLLREKKLSGFTQESKGEVSLLEEKLNKLVQVPERESKLKLKQEAFGSRWRFEEE